LKGWTGGLAGGTAMGHPYSTDLRERVLRACECQQRARRAADRRSRSPPHHAGLPFGAGRGRSWWPVAASGLWRPAQRPVDAGGSRRGLRLLPLDRTERDAGRRIGRFAAPARNPFRGVGFRRHGAGRDDLPPDGAGVFGMGPLEAVPEAAIVELAEAQARGGAVSGRPNRVWDTERGMVALGRFGLKANQPSLRQQIAAAFIGHLGITTSLYPARRNPASRVSRSRKPRQSRKPRCLRNHNHSNLSQPRRARHPGSRNPEGSGNSHPSR
jgi:hypothetical protein